MLTLIASCLIPFGASAKQAPPSHKVPATSHNASDLATAIKKRYPRVSTREAQSIANAAIKYEHPVFPNRLDIITIIAVESKFQCKAVSRGTYGCMQLKKSVWRGEVPNAAFTDPHTNIKYGIKIIRDYYVGLNHSPRAAIVAYNIGIESYKAGRRKPSYFNKYNKELVAFQSVLSRR